MNRLIVNIYLLSTVLISGCAIKLPEDLYDHYDKNKIKNLAAITIGHSTSNIFEFTYEGNDYILRVNDINNTSADCLKQEVEIATLAGEKEVGPKVYKHSNDYRWFVMKKLEATENYKKIPLEEIIAKLKEFNDLQPKFNRCNKKSIFEDKFKTQIVKYEVIDTNIKKNLQKTFKILKKLSPKNTKLVHGDAWHRNIISSHGDIFLIDFEYSQHGSPIMDISSLIADYGTFKCINELERNTLLEKFLEHSPSDKEKNLFLLWEIFWIAHKKRGDKCFNESVTETLRRKFKSERFKDIKLK